MYVNQIPNIIGIPGVKGEKGCLGRQGSDGSEIIDIQLDQNNFLCFTIINPDSTTRIEKVGPIEIGNLADLTITSNPDSSITIALGGSSTTTPGHTGEKGMEGSDGTDGSTVTNAVVDENGCLMIEINGNTTFNAGQVHGTFNKHR